MADRHLTVAKDPRPPEADRRRPSVQPAPGGGRWWTDVPAGALCLPTGYLRSSVRSDRKQTTSHKGTRIVPSTPSGEVASGSATPSRRSRGTPRCRRSWASAARRPGAGGGCGLSRPRAGARPGCSAALPVPSTWCSGAGVSAAGLRRQAHNRLLRSPKLWPAMTRRGPQADGTGRGIARNTPSGSNRCFAASSRSVFGP